MSCCKDAESLSTRLNKRITVFRQRKESELTEVDEYNQPVNASPIKLCDVWAEIKPLSGREFYEARKLHAEVTTQITIRFRADIDRTMIVKFKNTQFEVMYIINVDFENKELRLLCKELQ